MTLLRRLLRRPVQPGPRRALLAGTDQFVVDLTLNLGAQHLKVPDVHAGPKSMFIRFSRAGVAVSSDRSG
jgi:hypothetical protein